MKIKKLLIIYSALILGFATFLISIVLSGNINVNAGTDWYLVNSYANCNSEYCWCPDDVYGCNVDVHSCPDGFTTLSNGLEVCNNPVLSKTIKGGEKITVDSLLSDFSCTNIQIDLNRPEDSAYQGYYGAATLKWSDLSSCNLSRYPVVKPADIDLEPKCAYKSTQARVQRDINDPWKENMTIDCGEEFRVGSFHDNTGKFANDTFMQVVGPNLNKVVANETIVETFYPGTYTLNVKTYIPSSSDYFEEEACMATATVVCNPEAKPQLPESDKHPSFTITKKVVGDGVYEVGELVSFDIEIKNTGDESLNVFPIRDRIDNRYLDLVSMRLISHNNLDITNRFIEDDADDNTIWGTEDLIDIDRLDPDQSFVIRATYKVEQPIRKTCNTVFANPDSLDEKNAQACIGTIISTDL